MTTVYIILGSVAAALVYIAVVRSKAKAQGKAEAEGEMSAKHSEIMDEINEDDRTWNDDTRDPETEDEWDYFYLTGRKPDRVRRHDPKR